MDSSSCSSSDSESDNEGGPPVVVDPNDTSDKGLTLVDDNDSGLVLQLPPEGNEDIRDNTSFISMLSNFQVSLIIFHIGKYALIKFYF